MIKIISPEVIKLLSGGTEMFCVPWGLGGGTSCSWSPGNYGWGTGNLSTLGSIVSTLMPYIFAIAGIILLLMIVMAGYTLLTSAGNPEGIQKGTKRLTAGLIGFMIVFAAFWIWQLVAVFMGLGTGFPSP